MTDARTPIVKLAGEDGNAFAILGRWREAAHRKGWTHEEIKRVMDDATSDDYGHLLRIIMSNSEETSDEDDE